MTQEQVLNLLPENAIESGATPPGRYYIRTAKFVDDFDYGGTRDTKQTAAQFKLVTEDGSEYNIHWTVGDKTRMWPAQNGSALTGGMYTKSCNFYHGLTQAIACGLPANRLGPEGANITAAFEGIWADWIEFTPPGRSANAAGNMPKILIPSKVYLDGATPAAPVQRDVQTITTADVGTMPPPAPHFSIADTVPPPPSEATPQPPPPEGIIEPTSFAVLEMNTTIGIDAGSEPVGDF